MIRASLAPQVVSWSLDRPRNTAFGCRVPPPVGELEVRETAQDGLEGHLRLQSRKRCAQAVVHAPAEAQGALLRPVSWLAVAQAFVAQFPASAHRQRLRALVRSDGADGGTTPGRVRKPASPWSGGHGG